MFRRLDASHRHGVDVAVMDQRLPSTASLPHVYQVDSFFCFLFLSHFEVQLHPTVDFRKEFVLFRFTFKSFIKVDTGRGGIHAANLDQFTDCLHDLVLYAANDL